MVKTSAERFDLKEDAAGLSDTVFGFVFYFLVEAKSKKVSKYVQGESLGNHSEFLKTKSQQ